VARTTTGEWSRYYLQAEERRGARGGDPLRRHLKRYILRNRCLMAGASLLLAGSVATFYLVLIH